MRSNETRTLTYENLLSAQNNFLDNFLKELDQQPIFKRRKQLNLRSGNKPYPHFTYRYLPLTKEKDEKSIRNYLVESRLWLSSPSSFNDPFDMKCGYTFEETFQNKRKFLDEKFQQFYPDLPKHIKEETISDLLASNQIVAEILNEKYQNEIAQHGVCSFSDDARDILMWAHYGSDNKGVCLQFQITRDVFIFTHATAIGYSDKFPTINYLKDNLGKEAARAMWQKFKNWKYEKERRIIHPTGANSYLQFNPSALTALILGCKLESNSEKFIKSLLNERMQKNYPPLKIFRATQDNKEYKIRIKRVNNFS